jgi:hypothetical protein
MITAYVHNRNTSVNLNTYQITDTISRDVIVTEPVRGGDRYPFNCTENGGTGDVSHESPHFRGDSYWPNFVDK